MFKVAWTFQDTSIFFFSSSDIIRHQKKHILFHGLKKTSLQKTDNGASSFLFPDISRIKDGKILVVGID